MTTIALDDGRWFLSSDAQQFVSSDGDALYLVGSTWCLHSAIDDMMHQPATIVDAAGAVHWFARHGLAIPDVLPDAGDSTRIKATR